MTGIAEDIFNFFYHFVNPNNGIQAHLITNGSAGQYLQLLKSHDKVIPAFTVVNSAGGTALLGTMGAKPTFPLAVGASMTFRWKNPAKLGLVVDDQGTSVTLDIIG